MDYEFWQPLDPETEIRNLIPFSALLLPETGEAGIIAEYFHNPDSAATTPYTMNYQRLPSQASRSTRLILPRDATVGEKARQLLGTDAVFILPLPPVQWSRRGRPWRGRPVAAALAAALTGAATLIFGGTTGAWWFLPLAALAFGLVWLTAVERMPMRILAPGDLELDRSNVVEYARGRLRGERPEIRSREQRRAAILERVEQIKADYGRLSTDIIYRIENSALFDSSDPTTAQFQTALITFDGDDGTDLARLEELAGEVEVRFAVAQDHAETLGLHHLPRENRDTARRASNAARLAERATTDGERVASMRQVARILDSLALYYLPRVNPETLAIEAPPQP